VEVVGGETGVSSLKEVNLAVLEIDGNISILSENYQRHSRKKRQSQKLVIKAN